MSPLAVRRLSRLQPAVREVLPRPLRPVAPSHAPVGLPGLGLLVQQLLDQGVQCLGHLAAPLQEARAELVVTLVVGLGLREPSVKDHPGGLVVRGGATYSL